MSPSSARRSDITESGSGDPSGGPPAEGGETAPLVLTRRRPAELLATAVVDPSQPGERWWRYQRPASAAPPPPPSVLAPDPVEGSASGDPADPTPVVSPLAAARAAVPPASGLAPALVGVGILVATSIISKAGAPAVAVGTIPAAAVFLALGGGQAMARRHPDEPWLPSWLVAGVIYKITLSYLRFVTVVSVGHGNSDSEIYDKFGRRFALFWQGDGPNPALADLRKTNFVRWFTGAVYYLFGDNIMAGYFVFSLLALLGSYFWYRATVEAVPFIDKRLYLAFVLFAPSIAFWPSSIGKEALMQLALGTAALGIALMLNHRLLHGLPIVAAGGWLLWVVRPHLLALVALAASVSYFVGRVRRKETKEGGPLAVFSRPLGMVIVALLLIFTINQGAQFLGLTDLSLNSIQAELDATTLSTGQGDSSFDNGGNSLNPLYLPMGAATVLLRPFPWETDSPFQLLASLESMVLVALIVKRFSSIRYSLRRARSTPFLLFCWVLTLLYAATFSSFANFGLLVRQRSLVLPALFVLLAVDPRAARRSDPAGAPEAGPQAGPVPRPAARPTPVRVPGPGPRPAARPVGAAPRAKR